MICPYRNNVFFGGTAHNEMGTKSFSGCYMRFSSTNKVPKQQKKSHYKAIYRRFHKDFDSRIPLVRIQLAQPAKRPQRINILWRSFGIGGSYARCAAFLFFHPPRRPGFSKARLGARRLLVSTTGKKFSCRRLYIPANNCYTETSSYTIPRTVMVAMIRS